MAFPWNVGHDHRKGAWAYSFLLLALYFCYCTLVTVRAYQGRSAPPTSIVYDRASPIAFPDVLVTAPENSAISSSTSSKYASCTCYTRENGSDFGNKNTFVHTEDPSKPWASSGWASARGDSPTWISPGAPPFNMSYRDGLSCCEIQYGRDDQGRVHFIFKTSPISYVGDFTDGQLITMRFSDEVPQNQWVFITGGAQEIQWSKAILHSVTQVHLSPMRFNNLHEAPFTFFRAVTYYNGPADWLEIDVRLDGSGLQIVTQRDPVNVPDLLAKYGGIWFFVPLLFSLIYVSSGAEIRLTRISLPWIAENLLCSIPSREQEVLQDVQLQSAGGFKHLGREV